MEKIEVVELYPNSKTRKPRSIARKASKRPKALSEYRKGILARKALKKAYKRKYGTKTALQKADAIFSAKVRRRDGKCQFPGCPVMDFDKLQCSHYIGRATSSTRFDEKNCISLCWLHHFKDKMLGWEYQKQRAEVQGWDGQYTLFMRKWLGQEEFNALIERSRASVKRTDMVQAVLDSVDNLLVSPEQGV